MIIFKTRKRKQILAAAIQVIPEIVHAVEKLYPKGKTPGYGIKLEKAFELLKRQLSLGGLPIEILTAADDNLLCNKIHAIHKNMSGYKTMQMEELKRQGVIREIPTLTVYRD